MASDHIHRVMDIFFYYRNKISSHVKQKGVAASVNYPEILLLRIFTLQFLQSHSDFLSPGLNSRFSQRSGKGDFLQQILLPLFKDFSQDNAQFQSDLFSIFEFEKSLSFPDEIWRHTPTSELLFYQLNQFTWSIDEFNENPKVITPRILGTLLEKSIRLNQGETGDKSGLFYTPMIITSYIIDRVIETPDDITLKILDPAMGSGEFLLMALKKIQKLNSQPEFLMEVIEKILFGMDIQTEAIEIFKIRATFLLLNEECSKTPDFKNFKAGNSLLKPKNGLETTFSEVSDAGGFDIVVGNPPYLSSKEIATQQKEYYRKKYITAKGQFDLYSIFLERAVSILKNGGKLGFIIPESFLIRSNFSFLRKYLLDQAQIKEIHQIKGVFEDPKVANIVLILQNKPPKSDHEILFTKSNSLIQFQRQDWSQIQILQEFYQDTYKNSFLFLSKEEQELIHKVFDGNLLLGEVVEIHRGEEIGKESPLLNSSLIDAEHVPIISGDNVQLYVIRPPFKYIRKQDLQKISLYFAPKIVLRQLGTRLHAALDEKGEVSTLQTVYNIRSKNPNYSLKMLFAILNSSLYNYLYLKLFQEKEIFPRILIEHVKNLPIFPPDEKKHEFLELCATEIVKRLQDKTHLDKDLTMLRKKLDNHMFSIFNLNDKEIQLIYNALLQKMR